MSDEEPTKPVRVKQMEHEERMQDKKYTYGKFEKSYEERLLDKKIAHEQFKMEAEDDKRTNIMIAIIAPISVVALIAFCFGQRRFFKE